MKSIANQYRDLKEGKMSQFNFMRNLRMSMPQYITNVTSFKDAVRILKNKAILTEADLNELSPQTKYNAAMKAVDKINAASGTSDSTYTKALRQGNKFAQQIDPILKKAVEDFGESLGFDTRIEKATTGAKYEPIIQIRMGTDLGNPRIKVTITKDTDKIEGRVNIPDEAAERKLGNLIKQIQQKELDVELKKDDEEPEPAPSSIFEEGGSGDDEDELDAMIAKAEKEKEEEEAIKSGFGIYDPLEEDKKETYDKGDLVKYKNFPEGPVETGKVVKDLGDKVVIFDKKNGIEHGISKDKLVEAKKKKEPKSELHPNQIHPQELRMGIRVELEHTDDLDKAKKIALDHLKENPFYYTALKLSGIESPSAPKVKAPKEAPKKAKKKDATELVDKANQMVKVKELKKKLEEVNLNIDGEPNEVVKKAMTYVDGPNANPILKGLSNEIEFQQQGHSPNEALLRYKYWAKLPEEAVEKLKLQFDVDESTDYDEDTGDLFVYRLTPKQSPARNLGASLEMGTSKAGQMDAFKEVLEKIVRETIAEYYDGRDNLTDVTGETKI